MLRAVVANGKKLIPVIRALAVDEAFYNVISIFSGVLSLPAKMNTLVNDYRTKEMGNNIYILSLISGF